MNHETECCKQEKTLEYIKNKIEQNTDERMKAQVRINDLKLNYHKINISSKKSGVRQLTIEKHCYFQPLLFFSFSKRQKS